MEFTIKSGSPEKQRSACVVVGVFDNRKPSLSAELIDRASNGYISEIIRRGVTAADGIDERARHAFRRTDGRSAGEYKNREERGAAQWPRRAGSRKSGWFCSSPTIRSSPLLL